MILKIMIGIVIIAASFVYIMKNHSQTMMEALMKKRSKEDENSSN